MSEQSNKMIDRLLAHAAMCEEAAGLCLDADMAREFEKLAVECREAATDLAVLHKVRSRGEARAELVRSWDPCVNF
jgi:hypothetical protein